MCVGDWSSDVCSSDLMDLVTEDRIVAERDANEKKYEVVDYSYYLITVDYSDIEKEIAGTDAEAINEKSEEILTEYTNRINEARAFIETLTAKTTVEEFRTAVNEYVANKNYDAGIDGADFQGEKPSDEDLATIKAGILEAVFDDIKNGGYGISRHRQGVTSPYAV